MWLKKKISHVIILLLLRYVDKFYKTIYEIYANKLCIYFNCKIKPICIIFLISYTKKNQKLV